MSPAFFARATVGLALLSLTGCQMSKVGQALANSCIDQTKIRRDAVCAEIYAPVCGCDGQTYPNACVANNAGVTRYVTGPCDTQPGETGKPRQSGKLP